MPTMIDVRQRPELSSEASRAYCSLPDTTVEVAYFSAGGIMPYVLDQLR